MVEENATMLPWRNKSAWPHWWFAASPLYFVAGYIVWCYSRRQNSWKYMKNTQEYVKLSWLFVQFHVFLCIFHVFSCIFHERFTYSCVFFMYFRVFYFVAGCRRANCAHGFLFLLFFRSSSLFCFLTFLFSPPFFLLSFLSVSLLFSHIGTQVQCADACPGKTRLYHVVDSHQ